MKIIDCHCHIYPPKIAEKATAAIGAFYDIPMTYNGKMDQMLERERVAGIDYQIVFSVATHPEQVSPINHFIADTVSSGAGKFYGLGTVHPLSENMVGDIEEIFALCLKGIKIHPDFQKFAVDDEKFFPMYEICEKKNLPILIHTGDKRYDYSNYNRLIPILETFPKLKVVGAHLGGWSMWEEAVLHLVKYKNLYVDCSSSLYALAPETARGIVRRYGAERVMFGTDYPMWDPKAEVERVLSLGLDEAELESVFHKTAEEVFSL